MEETQELIDQGNFQIEIVQNVNKIQKYEVQFFIELKEF